METIFQIGKWYGNEDEFFKCTEIEGHNVFGNGYSVSYNWVNNTYFSNKKNNFGFKELNIEETKQRLISYANKNYIIGFNDKFYFFDDSFYLNEVEIFDGTDWHEYKSDHKKTDKRCFKDMCANRKIFNFDKPMDKIIDDTLNNWITENEKKYGEKNNDIISKQLDFDNKCFIGFVFGNLEKYLKRFVSDSEKANNPEDVVKILDYLSRFEEIYPEFKTKKIRKAIAKAKYKKAFDKLVKLQGKVLKEM